MTDLLESIVAWEVPQQFEQAVKCYVQEDVVCLTRGTSVFILSSSISEIEFDARVDAVSWCSDFPDLLVVGTRSGRILFIHTATNTTLFSRVVVEHECEDDQPAFIGLQFAQGKLLVQMLNKILILSCDLQLGLQHRSMSEVIDELQCSVDVTVLDLSGGSDVDSVAMVYPVSRDKLISTGHSDHMLCVWREMGGEYQLHDSISHWSEDSQVVRCEVTSCGKYLVLLTDRGSLSVWLASLLIMINVDARLGQNVRDFTFYRHRSNELSFSGDSVGKVADGLCLLTEDEEGKMFLQLLSLPSLQEDYSVEVSGQARLVHGTTTEENLYYVDVDGNSSSLQVIQLVQSLPEHRVAALISQQKFAKALEFARDHGVDVELVYKSKARLLNQQLANRLALDQDSVKLLVSLQECWENIMDEKFLFELVFAFPYLSLDVTAQILSCLKFKNLELSTKASDTLNWLATYRLVLGHQQFHSDSWQTFLGSGTLDLMKQNLSAGELHSVFLLHERHEESLVNEMDELSVTTVLMCLPEWVESQVLEEWLSLHFLPLVLQHLPQAVKDVLLWATDRITLLEMVEKENWPSNGLRVCEAVLDSVLTFKPLASLQPHPINFEVQLEKMSSLSDMKTLCEVLKDLVFLQTSIHWLDISLAEYRSEPGGVVVYRILDKLVATELVEDTIKTKVVPYVQRRGLNLDNVLLSYVKLFLDCISSSSWSAGPHEAKAIALIQTIRDVELHIEACVELLQHVQSDWSEEVEELVHSCLDRDHPACGSLRKQYRLLQLKKLLASYDIRDFNFANTTQGRFYIRRIMLSCSEKALQDALEVADMYHVTKTMVFKDYLVALVQREKMEEAADALDALPVDLRVATARTVVALASSKLAVPFIPDMDSSCDRIADIQLALLSLRCLRKCSKKEGLDVYWNGDILGEETFDLASTLDLYKRMLALQVEHNLYITPRDLDSKEKCMDLVKTKVSKCLADDPASSATRVRILTSFGSLLGVSESSLWRCVGELSIASNQQGRIKEFCRTLMANESVDSDVFLKVARHFWEKCCRFPNTVSKDDVVFVQSVLSHVASYCHGANLPEAVELFHFSMFFSSLYAVCTQMEGLGMMNESIGGTLSSSDGNQYFVDDGMVLDQVSLVPILAQYCLTASSVATASATSSTRTTSEVNQDEGVEKPENSPDESNETLVGVANQLSGLLEENGHSQLLLQCTVNTLSALNQEAVKKHLTKTLSLSSEQSKGLAILYALMTAFTEKVLCSSRVDHHYSLCLLLALPPSEAEQLLKSMRTSHSVGSYARATGLCQLCLDYCHVVGGLPKLETESLAMLKKAEWGQLLGRYKISYTRVFRGGGPEARRGVATALLLNREVEVDTIMRFYQEELNQEPQITLEQYLTTVLTKWEEPYKERAEFLMNRIASKRVLDLFSRLLFSKVHPYDYQKIAFLLQFLQRGGESVSSLKTSQGLLVLDCLKNYQRLAPPTESERQWYTDHYMMKVAGATISSSSSSNGGGGVLPLPSQSATCLPFHPLLYGDDPMKIISPEFSRSSIAVLTAVARLIKLPMNDFYTSAIQNIVVQSKLPEPLPVRQTQQQQQQQQQPAAGESLEFGELLPLLNKISDPSYALTGARWLAENLHGEENKRRALETALEVARKTREQAGSERELSQASADVGLLESMLAISQSERLLQQHQLDLPKYTGLTSHSLIMELYQDAPELLQQPEVPPLHNIVAELAKIYKVSLNKIRSKLSEQWLLSLGHHNASLDTTMSQVSDLDESIGGSAQDLPSPENADSLIMKRLVYLLSDPSKLGDNIIMLLNWAKHSTTPVSCLCRVRALQVLLAVASPSEIERVSGTSLADIRDFMLSALVVCELESLKVAMTLPAFFKCNKPGLVRTLWRNHAQKPVAIRLVSELCLYYKLGDAQLWKKTLSQLLQLKMFPYLRVLLQKLLKRSEIDVPSLCGVWWQCILQPLEAMAVPLTAADEEECDESLKMFYKAPMPWQLEGMQVVDMFDSLGLLAHALASSSLLPEQQRKDIQQRLLSNLTKDDLLPVLEVKLPVGGDQVKALLFSHLENQDSHELLLGTEQFSQLVKFLVSRKSIDKLLRKSLQLERYGEAIRLVEMYNSEHSVETSFTGREALLKYIVSSPDSFQSVVQELLLRQ